MISALEAEAEPEPEPNPETDLYDFGA